MRSILLTLVILQQVAFGKNFSTPEKGKLTMEMKKFYDENGYLVLEDFYSLEETKILKKRAKDLAKEKDAALTAEEREAAIFVAKKTQGVNEYFLDSAHKLQIFFEEDKKTYAKLAHNLLLDPIFRKYTVQPSIYNVAKTIGFKDPRVMQTMVIFKDAKAGGVVQPHQDATFLITDPPSSVAFWIPLEDTDPENSCLWILPGYHKFGLKQKFVTNHTKIQVERKELSDRPWPHESYIPLPVRAGALVIIHPLLPHKSDPNLSDRSRNAYTFHVIEGSANYSPDNWMKKPEKGFEPLVDESK